MTRTLVILRAGAAFAWGLFDDESKRLLQQGAAPDLASVDTGTAEPADRVWGIIPGADVLARRVELPVPSVTQALQSLPFLLEDDLAVDREDLHFALGDFTDGQWLAAALARDVMDAWAKARTFHALVPDFLALGDGAPAIFAHDGNAIVTLADGGFAIEWDSLAHVVPPGLDAQRHQTLSTQDFLERAYQRLSSALPLSLLQGDYAPRRTWPVLSPLWRRAAIMAGVALALGISVSVADGLRLNHEAAQATARAESVFRQAFPDVTRVVNARAQMKAKLAELRSGSSFTFLQLAGLLADGVAAAPGVEIDAMRFDGARGELAASLSLGSFEQIEAVKAAVAGKGGRIDEGSARQSGARIAADVVVRLP
jgi:general secretion pathway protein L